MKTYFEIQRDLKQIDKDIKFHEKLLKRVEEIESNDKASIEYFEESIAENKQEKEQLLNQLNELNKGKDIGIEYDGDYDAEIMRIIFPKGTSKQFKREWLYKNNMPIYSESYHIDSPYDCTGRIFATDVEYHKNEVILTSHRDV